MTDLPEPLEEWPPAEHSLWDGGGYSMALDRDTQTLALWHGAECTLLLKRGALSGFMRKLQEASDWLDGPEFDTEVESPRATAERQEGRSHLDNFVRALPHCLVCKMILTGSGGCDCPKPTRSVADQAAADERIPLLRDPDRFRPKHGGYPPDDLKHGEGVKCKGCGTTKGRDVVRKESDRTPPWPNDTCPRCIRKASPSAMNLTVRAEKALDIGGVTTVEQLLGCSDRDLLTMKHFGRKELVQVDDLLARWGLWRSPAKDPLTMPPPSGLIDDMYAKHFPETLRAQHLQDVRLRGIRRKERFEGPVIQLAVHYVSYEPSEHFKASRPDDMTVCGKWILREEPKRTTRDKAQVTCRSCKRTAQFKAQQVNLTQFKGLVTPTREPPSSTGKRVDQRTIELGDELEWETYGRRKGGGLRSGAVRRTGRVVALLPAPGSGAGRSCRSESMVWAAPHSPGGPSTFNWREWRAGPILLRDDGKYSSPADFSITQVARKGVTIWRRL